MTIRMCKVCSDWHDLEAWPEKCHRQSKSNAPYVISDTMEPTKHMASGRLIDSKAKFRAETKATGCVELGNEPIRQRAPVRLDKRERREAIQKAMYQLRQG
jgi:hypothetical protein